MKSCKIGSKSYINLIELIFLELLKKYYKINEQFGSFLWDSEMDPIKTYVQIELLK